LVDFLCLFFVISQARHSASIGQVVDEKKKQVKIKVCRIFASFSEFLLLLSIKRNLEVLCGIAKGGGDVTDEL